MDAAKNYHRQLFTKTVASIEPDEKEALKQQLNKKSEEAILIYNIRDKEMVFHDGWLDILGVRKGEMNMLYLVDFIDPQYKEFVLSVTDTALYYLKEKRSNIMDYSFVLEMKLIHQLSRESLPIRASFFSFSENKDGYLQSVMGRFEVDRSIVLKEKFRYTVYTPDKLSYIEGIDNKLFESHHITYKELEALKLITRGFAIKQIAAELNISHSAAEKRIYALYKRFDVKSIGHLISFCYKNLILCPES